MKRAFRAATVGALGVIAVALAPAPVLADVIYTLNSSNDVGTSGVGPFAQVDIHWVNTTTATAEFTRLGGFVFGEMGLNVNASTFTATGLSFILAPGSGTPTYTVSFGGKVGGIGNFALDYVANPNGASDAVTEAKFTLTNTSGTWADETQVLVNAVPEAAVHAFVQSSGNSFFASGGPTTCTDGCVITPVIVDTPEPMSLALLAVGMLGIGVAKRRRLSRV